MKKRRVLRAYQNIRPNEEAKARMLNNILLSSEIPPAGKDERIMRKKMRPGMLVAVVAIIAAMTVTVFAAEAISGWFKQYFEKQNGAPLTAEQIEYIEEVERVMIETQTQNGYELNLKSVMADGNTLYITLGVTAPTTIPFGDIPVLTNDGIEFFNQETERPFSSSIRVLDDMDGLDSTVDILFEFAEGNWGAGELWTLRIEKLVALIHDTEYEQELLDTKYAGQDNIMFSDEEVEKIYRHDTIAEGPWEFAIDTSKADNEELQITTESIVTKGVSGFKNDGSLVYEDVVITSITIRPLGATIYSELTESRAALDITPTSDDRIFVIMKDGTSVELRPDWSMPGEAHFIASSPIVLEEVDYVQLPDGTRIMAQ